MKRQRIIFTALSIGLFLAFAQFADTIAEAQLNIGPLPPDHHDSIGSDDDDCDVRCPNLSFRRTHGYRVSSLDVTSLLEPARRLQGEPKGRAFPSRDHCHVACCSGRFPGPRKPMNPNPINRQPLQFQNARQCGARTRSGSPAGAQRRSRDTVACTAERSVAAAPLAIGMASIATASGRRELLRSAGNSARC
jgi:hypothetical protein